MSALKSMVDSNGEISKNDLQVHVKNSKIWKGFLECKAITGSSPQVSKVQRSMYLLLLSSMII